MPRRAQLAVLGILVAVLVLVLYVMYRPESRSAANVRPEERFVPVNVDNPALRLDILKRFLAIEYKGVHRNIFSGELPPPPPPPPGKNPQQNGAAAPAGPPPLTVDAKYFGYVSDFAGNHRWAFFSTNNNEDVFIAGEGDTLMGRFRVVRITNTTADVEEVSSGRRATLVLEPTGPNG